VLGMVKIFRRSREQ